MDPNQDPSQLPAYPGYPAQQQRYDDSSYGSLQTHMQAQLQAQQQQQQRQQIAAAHSMQVTMQQQIQQQLAASYGGMHQAAGLQAQAQLQAQARMQAQAQLQAQAQMQAQADVLLLMQQQAAAAQQAAMQPQPVYAAALPALAPHLPSAALPAPVRTSQPMSAPAPAAPLAQVPAYLQEFYEVIGKIGEGTYGVVYLARNREQTSRLLAVKTFKTGREGDGVSLTAVREICLLRELHHPNIVRLDSVHINRQEPILSLAFDYAEHDLYEMIRHHREALLSAPFHPYTLKCLAQQLLAGLAHLHENWVVHRDLKPSNILVMGEGEEAGVVKIGDFGLARVFRSPLRPLCDNGVVVTIWYRAPELLLGAKHYTPAIDLWAAGCIFAELLTLRPLFQGEERKAPTNAFQSDQVDKIFRLLGPPQPATCPALEHLPHWRDDTEGVRTRRAASGGNVLDDYILAHSGLPGLHKGCALLDLLQQLLAYDPQKRLSARQALEHEFFKEEPLPGQNSFVNRGKVAAYYPRRTKYDPATAPEPAPPPGTVRRVTPLPAGGTGTNAAAYATAPSGQAPAQAPAATGRKRRQDWAVGPGFR